MFVGRMEESGCGDEDAFVAGERRALLSVCDQCLPGEPTVGVSVRQARYAAVVPGRRSQYVISASQEKVTVAIK